MGAAELVEDAAGQCCVRRSDGFASQIGLTKPREASPRLSIPGLYYAAPSGLVCCGVDWWKMTLTYYESSGREALCFGEVSMNDIPPYRVAVHALDEWQSVKVGFRCFSKSK